MNVVIVDGDVSFPPTSGKRLRTLHLMLRLARRHHVTYAARGDIRGDAARQAQEYFRDHRINPLLVHDPVPRKSGALFHARLVANLLSALPYSVASHHSAQLSRTLQRHTDRHPVDLWQFESTPYVGVVGSDVAAPRLLVAHNVDSLIWRRYRDTEAGALRRWYVHQQARKFERLERTVFNDVTRVVTCTAEDATLVRERFGMSRVDVVENGIDRAYFEGVRHECQPHRILFLGSLDWRPNLDAVALLLDRIFPAVLAREPRARLSVVGRRPPDALVRRCRALAGVELHPDVSDVRPHLASSSVMTVPLRIGGGSRLKILEALACGLPVVSTRVGAEGLILEPGRDLVVVDTPEDMAGALVSCLQAPGPAREMATRGRRRVLDRYDWDSLADKLERVWETCISPAAAASALLAGGPRP